MAVVNRVERCPLMMPTRRRVCQLPRAESLPFAMDCWPRPARTRSRHAPFGFSLLVTATISAGSGGFH